MSDVDTPVEYLPVIIRLSSDDSADNLESMGVIIWRTRDDLAIGAVPREIINDVIGSRWINDISSAASSLPSMNRAAGWVGLDKVRAGIDLPPEYYDGDGVVVGFSDIGYDPSHVAFLNEDGAPRTVRLTHYDARAGLRQECSTRLEIEEWTTDNINKYHATHVCGILAGHTPVSPYNGVAGGAEIVATTSNLYDPEILGGIEDVIEYAKSVGKPAVVNLSLSSSMGPHDGTQLFNEYIDKLGKEAIITVSAGNSATVPIVVSKILTEDDTSIGTAFMEEWVWRGFNVAGACDFWSDSDLELGTDLLIIDDIKHEIVGRIKIQNDETIIVSSEFADDYPAGIVDPLFDSLFSGVVMIYREVNQLNNRYNVYVDFSYSTRLQETPRGWAQSWIGVELNGEPGTRVDGYASNGIHLTSKSSLLTPVSGVGSINDIATAHNLISVGAYSTCNSVMQLSGEQFDYKEYNEGEIAYFSSYGTLVDGRKLPIVSAPGAVIVSAVSSPYLDNGGEFKPFAYSEQHFGKTYFWGAEAGTSMSAPLVAGGIALWLQADPSLTVEDVKRILTETSPLPAGAVAPGWGCGSFNLYDGLQMVRKESGVENVTEPLGPSVVRNGDLFSVTAPGSGQLNCSLITMDGKTVIIEHGEESVSIDLEGLSRGVYILNIRQEQRGNRSIKILL